MYAHASLTHKVEKVHMVEFCEWKNTIGFENHRDKIGRLKSSTI